MEYDTRKSEDQEDCVFDEIKMETADEDSHIKIVSHEQISDLKVR